VMGLLAAALALTIRPSEGQAPVIPASTEFANA
jgi:hypothetical protein